MRDSQQRNSCVQIPSTSPAFISLTVHILYPCRIASLCTKQSVDLAADAIFVAVEPPFDDPAVEFLLDKDNDYTRSNAEIGEEITYGTVIQFKHVKTNQYLTMEDASIKLTAQPSKHTLIKLIPAERIVVNAAQRAKPVRYTEKVALLNMLTDDEKCYIKGAIRHPG